MSPEEYFNGLNRKYKLIHKHESDIFDALGRSGIGDSIVLSPDSITDQKKRLKFIKFNQHPTLGPKAR